MDVVSSKFFSSKRVSRYKENDVSTEANEIFVSLKEQVTIWKDINSSTSRKGTFIDQILYNLVKKSTKLGLHSGELWAAY